MNYINTVNVLKITELGSGLIGTNMCINLLQNYIQYRQPEIIFRLDFVYLTCLCSCLLVRQVCYSSHVLATKN
jgi:hypothetical protein